MAERVRVRDITNQEGNRLLRIVRRSSGSDPARLIRYGAWTDRGAMPWAVRRSRKTGSSFGGTGRGSGSGGTVTLPFIPHDDPRVIDSTGALDLADIPQRLLVVGGGIIGLEMATVYSELGSTITVVELLDQLIPGAEKDVVAPLTKRITKRYDAIHLKTKVTNVEASAAGAITVIGVPRPARIGPSSEPPPMP